MIYTILMVSAVVLSILIIFFILMQKGKGDASGMFGGGSSGAVFGASGAGKSKGKGKAGGSYSNNAKGKGWPKGEKAAKGGKKSASSKTM